MGAYGKVYALILLVCIVFYVAIGTDFAKATSEDYTTMKIEQGSSLYTVYSLITLHHEEDFTQFESDVNDI